MSEEQYPSEQTPDSLDDNTRASEATPFQSRPRELPRRGYEGQPRPMNPPPPPPVSASGGGRTIPPTPPDPGPAYPAPAPAYQRRNYDYTAEPPVQPRQSRPRRASRSDSGLYLPWWSLVILVVVAGGGAFGLLYAVISLGVGQNPGDQPPRFIVVTNPVNENQQVNTNNSQPAVINTPGAIPTTFLGASTDVPQASPSETFLPGVGTGCPLNAIVEVVGTEGLPLLIREGPRQSDVIQSQAASGEQLKIVAGPETSTSVDGVTQIEWCRVEGVTVPSRSGWAARQYLSQVGTSN